jgi:hypothetical protein
LIIFLKQINVSAIETLRDLVIATFYKENIDSNSEFKVYDLTYHKLTTCLTAISLIIEQINLNDFNENLGISNIDEMKNLIKEEYEKDLINLVQRSFEYQKLLNNDIILQLLSINKLIFGLEKGFYNNFNHFDNNIRLIYLQILYLIITNKNGVNLFQEYVNMVDIFEKLYTNEPKVGDCKIV